MSDREHFIATLQACYFGDKNAFDEIVRIYDKKESITKEIREYITTHKLYCFEYDEEELFEITTDYVGKISYYEMEINSKIVCIQTEIQKTQFKIYFCDKEDK